MFFFYSKKEPEKWNPSLESYESYTNLLRNGIKPPVGHVTVCNILWDGYFHFTMAVNSWRAVIRHETAGDLETK